MSTEGFQILINLIADTPVTGLSDSSLDSLTRQFNGHAIRSCRSAVGHAFDPSAGGAKIFNENDRRLFFDAGSVIHGGCSKEVQLVHQA